LRPQVQAIAALALTGLILMSPAPAIAEDYPLAAADQGKNACYKPNMDKRTCWVISAYKKRDDGTYEASTKARFHNTTDYESRTTAIISIKAGRLCNTLDKSRIDQARFFHLGDEVIKQDLEDLRAQVIDQLKSKFGKEYCDELTAADANGQIKITSYIDGEQQNSGVTQDTMIWVSPDDGYKLRSTAE
jgi:hypothetical protein